jgi:hypothetical protein
MVLYKMKLNLKKGFLDQAKLLAINPEPKLLEAFLLKIYIKLQVYIEISEKWHKQK